MTQWTEAFLSANRPPPTNTTQKDLFSPTGEAEELPVKTTLPSSIIGKPRRLQRTYIVVVVVFLVAAHSILILPNSITVVQYYYPAPQTTERTRGSQRNKRLKKERKKRKEGITIHYYPPRETIDEKYHTTPTASDRNSQSGGYYSLIFSFAGTSFIGTRTIQKTRRRSELKSIRQENNHNLHNFHKRDIIKHGGVHIRFTPR